MAEKILSTQEEVRRIRETLRVRDPESRTVLLGSAAIVAHFCEIGAEPPLGCGDIDVLCSQAYFEDILQRAREHPEMKIFRLRRPGTRLTRRGATNWAIDIYPPESSLLLPFTVAVDMSDSFVSTTYTELRDIAVERIGIPCAPLYRILDWLSTIGRDKDIVTVDQVLPLAVETGLITKEEEVQILEQLHKTVEDRQLNPEKYTSGK